MSAAPAADRLVPPAAPTRGATSYWQWVLARVLRPTLVKLAAGYVVLLLALAVFVPFLANSHPFTIVLAAHAGRPAVREFPLWRDLTNVDWAWLIGGTALLVYALLHWHTRDEPSLLRRRRRRLTWFLSLAALAVISASLTAIFHHNVLDARDYRAMIRHHEASGAWFAPIPWGYAEMEPLQRNLTNQLPSRRHWLGTDSEGRDELARLLWSARVAMEIGFVSQVVAITLGLLFGAPMGYFVGVVDILGMRVLEIVESIPTFFLILTFIAIYGRNLLVIMLIIGATSWTGIARFIRAEFLRIRQLDYVTAATAAGLPLHRVLFRHMLPNGITPIIISASFGIAGAIMSESGLSFLGVGVPPPTPSWGEMLNAAGQPGVMFRWWQALGPGGLLFLTVLAFNLIGQSLRDAINPQ